MEAVTRENLSVRQSDNINYVWARFDEPVSNAAFKDALRNKSFLALLKEHKTNNLLLDCSRLGSFSIPEMSDYLDIDFMSAMERAHIKKVSVIIDERILYMMPSIFQQITSNHTDGTTQIRFFNPGQFNQSAESVAWFN